VTRPRIFDISFASVYPHYVHKAERKSRSKEEVNQIISWLTGYDPREGVMLLCVVKPR